MQIWRFNGKSGKPPENYQQKKEGQQKDEEQNDTAIKQEIATLKRERNGIQKEMEDSKDGNLNYETMIKVISIPVHSATKY